VLIAAYQLSHLGGDVQASRDGFLDPAGEPIQGTKRQGDDLCPGPANVLGQGRGKGLRVIVIGAGPRLVGRDTCLPEWFRPG